MGLRRLTLPCLPLLALFFAGTCAAAIPLPAFLPAPTPMLQSKARQHLATESPSPKLHLGTAAARDMLLTLAYSLRDTPYRWGGHTPSSGFDCSGLVRYVFRRALGVDLPHRARLQYDKGKAVKRSQLEPGDLVFFHTEGSRISHVGIYLDDGRFLHAPRSGEDVRVSRLDNPYWKRHYAGARRLAVLAGHG